MKEENVMWKKPNDAPEPRPAPPPPAPVAHPPRASARIGSSLVFKGELQGEEDLIIEGKVEGKIVLSKGSVTVGEKGRVEADVQATSIEVAGQVRGNLTGAERVVLHESGRVEGNIKTKSVVLANGCRFQGSIDMETERKDRALVPAARVGA
jgi:cytoskeletal protein CcmA (bactofilin family)